MRNLPGLIEGDGNPQIAPGEFLTDQAQGQDIRSGAAHLLGKSEGPESQAAPLLHHLPGKAQGWIGDFLLLVGDGPNLPLGEVMRQLLESYLLVGEAKIHGETPFTRIDRADSPDGPPR